MRRPNSAGRRSWWPTVYSLRMRRKSIRRQPPSSARRFLTLAPRATRAELAGAALIASIALWAAPSVFPTGATIYDPAKAWNGFTVLSPLGGDGAVVIDMNGNVVKRWEGYNSSAGGPA